jgi:hypothetical protein
MFTKSAFFGRLHRSRVFGIIGFLGLGCVIAPSHAENLSLGINSQVDVAISTKPATEDVSVRAERLDHTQSLLLGVNGQNYVEYIDRLPARDVAARSLNAVESGR